MHRADVMRARIVKMEREMIAMASDWTAKNRHIEALEAQLAAAELRAQHARIAELEVPQFIVALPQTAAEVREFMNSNCEREEYANDDGSPSDDDRYMLTAHDFLTAVDEWADFLNAPAETRPPQQ